jgi:mono/diheme cytochrome c family protein
MRRTQDAVDRREVCVTDAGPRELDENLVRTQCAEVDAANLQRPLADRENCSPRQDLRSCVTRCHGLKITRKAACGRGCRAWSRAALARLTRYHVDVRLVCVLVVIILVARAFAAPPAPAPALLSMGKTQYEANCAACHGATGEGDGPVAFAVKPPPRNFRKDPFKAGDAVPQIFVTVTNGLSNTRMVGYPQLKEEERWALAYYVRALRLRR